MDFRTRPLCAIDALGEDLNHSVLVYPTWNCHYTLYLGPGVRIGCHIIDCAVLFLASSDSEWPEVEGKVRLKLFSNEYRGEMMFGSYLTRLP